MRIELSIAKSVLLLAACLGLHGCGGSQSTEQRAATPSSAATHEHEPGHGHEALHDGQIIDLGKGEYHAELTHDDAMHKVGVYVLDATAQRAAPIESPTIAINCLVNGQPKQFVLSAAPQPDDPPGKASYFELVSEPLCDAWDAADSHARLNVAIAGRPYVGDIEAHDHAAGHGHSHAGDDALVWRQELEEQGYHLALGHHGQTLRAGHEVEPAVQITREGQPFAAARVFNSLLSGDGRAVLADEVATVYEPTTSEEPAHYAQGALQIPADTQAVVIRYRIVFPESGGERTYDVSVPVE